MIHELVGNPKLIETIAEDDIELLRLMKNDLPPYAVEVKWQLKKLNSQAITFWEIIESIEEYEKMFLNHVIGESDTNLPDIHCNLNCFSLPQTYSKLEPGLIDVYKSFEQFKIEKLSEEEGAIPYLFIGEKANLPFRFTGEYEGEERPSIPSKQEFLKRFKIFTNDQLEGWDDWENMIVIGGAVSNCLFDIPIEYIGRESEYFHDVAYKTSDIDIYCFGISDEEFFKKLWSFYNFLLHKHNSQGREQVLVFKTPHTVTFVTEYPNRQIQFVLGKWESMEHLLLEPDVDCSCFGYQGIGGGRVITTQRGRFSLNYRTIITSPSRYAVRGCAIYESRLIKYSKRGFIIRDRKLDWEQVDEFYIESGKNDLLRKNGLITKVFGLRILIALHEHSHELKDSEFMTYLAGEELPSLDYLVDVGIPYGRGWTIDKIQQGYYRGVQYYTAHYHNHLVDEHPTLLLENLIDPEQLSFPFSDLMTHNKIYALNMLSVSDGKKIESSAPLAEDWYFRVFKEDRINEIVRHKNALRDNRFDYSCNRELHGKLPSERPREGYFEALLNVDKYRGHINIPGVQLNQDEIALLDYEF